MQALDVDFYQHQALDTAACTALLLSSMTSRGLFPIENLWPTSGLGICFTVRPQLNLVADVFLKATDTLDIELQ